VSPVLRANCDHSRPDVATDAAPTQAVGRTAWTGQKSAAISAP